MKNRWAKVAVVFALAITMMGAGAVLAQTQLPQQQNNIQQVWACANRNGRVTNVRWNAPPRCGRWAEVVTWDAQNYDPTAPTTTTTTVAQPTTPPTVPTTIVPVPTTVIDTTITTLPPDPDATIVTTLPPTDPTTTTTQGQVQAPVGLSASASGDDVLLSWSAPNSGPAPSSYRVYRNGSIVEGTVGTSYTDTDVAPGTYSYTIRSVGNDGGTSADSNSASVVVGQAGSIDPSTVTASGTASPNAITVTMTADVCFTSYRVRAIPTGSAPQPLPVLINGSPCETTKTAVVAGLLTANDYDVTVSVWTTEPTNSVGDTFSITTTGGFTSTTLGPDVTLPPTTGVPQG